ncbi:MAG: PPE domain-containing protein [Proteobacteria bacterium]|nr:PPE domain-containing protein [Pseudomonadota bacterium]
MPPSDKPAFPRKLTDDEMKAVVGGAGPSPADWLNKSDGASAAVQAAASITTFEGAKSVAAGTASPYASWLSAAAEPSQSAAGQAAAAASALEKAMSATGDPASVAANRGAFAALVSSNSGVAAAPPSIISEMWAQDIGALSNHEGGAGASSAAPQTDRDPK